MLTQMSEEDWDVVLMVFRAVLPRRGDKGRDGKRGKRAGGGFPKTRMSDSIWGCCPESTSTIYRRRI